MRLLGAILAGGRSTRFGSDKALAVLDGRPLIEHVRAALAPHTDDVIVCGRDVPDRPAPDLGPLGGLNAALHHALASGFDAVLTAPCDTPMLPPDLADILTRSSAAYVADLPVIGLWPAAWAPRLDAFLAGSEDRSIRAFARLVAAVPVTLAAPVANINRPEDLAALGRDWPRARPSC